MPRAICEDCGSLVEAELTHNGVCAVGHYVHCGWGHELSPDDLISHDAAQIIEELEAKLAKAHLALNYFLMRDPDKPTYWEYRRDRAEELARDVLETTQELTGGKDD